MSNYQEDIIDLGFGADEIEEAAEFDAIPAGAYDLRIERADTRDKNGVPLAYPNGRPKLNIGFVVYNNPDATLNGRWIWQGYSLPYPKNHPKYSEEDTRKVLPFLKRLCAGLGIMWQGTALDPSIFPNTVCNANVKKVPRKAKGGAIVEGEYVNEIGSFNKPV